MAAALLLRAILFAGMLVSCTAAPQDSSAGTAGSSPDTPVTSSPDPQDTGAGGASTPPAGPALPSDCNAPKAEPFVGRRADASVRTALTNAVAHITAIRWVEPGDATTEDYSPQRLNVMLDVGGAIRSVHCG